MDLNSLPIQQKLDSKIGDMSLSLEQKIISYLSTYGNTKETDLITYAEQRLGISKEEMLKLIDEMVFTDKIERILHKELEPAVTYIKRGSLVPLELELQALSDSLELNEATNHQIEKIREILQKADAVAKKRIKQEINAKD